MRDRLWSVWHISGCVFRAYPPDAKRIPRDAELCCYTVSEERAKSLCITFASDETTTRRRAPSKRVATGKEAHARRAES